MSGAAVDFALIAAASVADFVGIACLSESLG
jgi:hypothetical protein